MRFLIVEDCLKGTNDLLTILNVSGSCTRLYNVLIIGILTHADAAYVEEQNSGIAGAHCVVSVLKCCWGEDQYTSRA